jgi:hypothetical protein
METSGAPTKPFEPHPLARLLGLLLPVVLSIGCYFVWYLFYSEYAKTHTDFPLERHSSQGAVPTQWEAYSATQSYLSEHAKPNLDRDFHYSDPPFWFRDCEQNERGVRIVTKVINPANGETNDVTLYFCAFAQVFSRPANPEARYFTGTE